MKGFQLFIGLTLLLLYTSLVNASAVSAQGGQTTVTVTTVTIPVHAYDSALVYHLNPTYNMSYAKLDGSRYDPGKIINRTFNLVILENDYLKVSLLPELGGRVYQAIFKPTGNNIFYQNPVLKPSPWGPPEMGWWLAAGGMEWGLPVEEHGYEWGIPWSYRITDTPDGAAVEVWDTNAANRLRARVVIALADNAANFVVSPTLENPTAQPIDYKFWINAMLAPGPANSVSPNLRIIMPTQEVTVHSTGDSRLPGPYAAAGWPIHNGVDWSRLGNWREWYGFFQRPRAAGDFQAIYDEGYDEGVVRTYDSQVAQGAKFFAFGSGPQAISPDLYTDDGSSYVEIHGGAAPTFADTRRLEPGQSITWSERWYPVAGLGSLTWANERLALHLQDQGDTTQLHLAVTRPTPNPRLLLLRRATNQILYEEQLAQLTPDQPYHSPLLMLPNLTPADMAVVVYDDSGALLGAYQYQGGPPVTPTPGPSPTPTLAPAWQGRLLRLTPIAGWSSIVRIWVRNKIGLPVTIAAAAGGWSTTGKTGTKPEYGVDALEFAPLAPGTYLITPQGLNTTFRLTLPAGTIGEVLFDQTTAATPTPTASATPTATKTPAVITTPPATIPPTAALTATPLPSATPTSTPSPTATATPTATPTPTPISAWSGRIRRVVPIAGWSSVARLWVSGQRQTAVTLSALNWNWQATGYTGSKPEYGPDALEFAPLPPGRYRTSVPKFSARFDFDLPSGAIAEIVFEPATPPTAVPTATSIPSATPTATHTPTPTSTPSPSPTATITPTDTPTATATPTDTPTLTATPPVTSPPPDTPVSLTPSATPSETPTPTASPTVAATPTPTWQARIPVNTTVPGNWFAVIRVSVQGQVGLPVRITLISPTPWSATCLTGAKPEFGPDYCEFAPLIPGQYIIQPQGINATAELEVGRSGVAVVIFERG